MLKHIITSLESVVEAYRPLYTKQEDGTYKLNVDDSGLKQTNQSLKQEKQILKEKLEAIEAAKLGEEERYLRENKKFEELLKLKEESLSAATTTLESKIAQLTQDKDKLQGALTNHIKGQEVAALSKTLAGDNAALIQPHIEAKLVVETVDGVPQVSYLDDKGNPGASKESLMEAFRANPVFKSVMLGRNSSGGGSGGGEGGGQGDHASYEAAFNPNSSSYDTFKQQELKEKNPQAHDTLVKKYRLDDPYPTHN